MIEMAHWHDIVALVAIAGVSGSIGGFVAELLLVHRGQTGRVERPGRSGARHYDLGVLANITIGAVAAVAALYVLPPTETTNTIGAGTQSTTVSYDVIKLIAFSLIVGSAGSAVMSALQARAIVIATAEKAQAVQRVTLSGLKAVEDAIRDGVDSGDLQATVAAVRNTVRASVDSGSGSPGADDL